MSRGTVNIARAIFSSANFKAEKFTQREAFIWLVMEASWRPRRKSFQGGWFDLERGELVASVRFMAEAWGWDKSTAHRYIEKLTKRGMIEKRNASGTPSGTPPSIITICNYEEYQSLPADSETPKKTEVGHQRDTTETNYKKEEIKGEKGKEERASAPPPKKPRLSDGFPSDVSPEVVSAFIAHRKALRRPLTPHAVTLLSKTLGAIRDAGLNMDDALNLAIERGWQTIKLEWALRELAPNDGGPGNGRNHQTTPRKAEAKRRTDRVVDLGRRLDAQRGSAGTGHASDGDVDPDAHHRATQPFLRAGHG